MGPYWIGNLLIHILDWRFSGTVKTFNWRSQLDVRYDGVSVLWRGVIPVCPAYLPRIMEIRATLRAASVTISFDRTVWRESKVSPIPVTSSVIIWSMRRIAPGIIFGMNRLRINLCGEIFLVVSVSVIFFCFHH